jgi:hypothetical protein
MVRDMIGLAALRDAQIFLIFPHLPPCHPGAALRLGTHAKADARRDFASGGRERAERVRQDSWSGFHLPCSRQSTSQREVIDVRGSVDCQLLTVNYATSKRMTVSALPHARSCQFNPRKERQCLCL